MNDEPLKATRRDLIDRLRRMSSISVPLGSAMIEGIEHSARYLASDAALASIALDPYWPKWDSPWWHALLLFEIGEAARIPRRTAEAIAARIDSLEHTFPMAPGDFDPALDPSRHYLCHCALGCMTQVLVACEVPPPDWVSSWFARYQMADGGLNCDSESYLVTGECPSSMVGTIPLLEAAIATGANDRAVIDRAALCVLERELRRGSSTVHNAEEREAATSWLLPTFPRFYFYDVLRGLSAVTNWARATNAQIPTASVSAVLDAMLTAYPDGVVTVGRNAFTKHGSRAPGATPEAHWERVPVASRFALMQATCEIGQASPALTAQWSRVRRDIVDVLSTRA